MPGIRVKVTGAQAIVKNLATEAERWKRALAVGLYKESNFLMEVSKSIVPLDIGALRASGYVTMPVTDPSLILLEMGYGGDVSGSYAEKQHERLDFRHAPGRQAKYLSAAIEKYRNNFAASVAVLAQAAYQTHQKPQRTNMPVTPNEGEQMYAAQIVGELLQSSYKQFRAAKSIGKAFRSVGKELKKAKGGKGGGP